TSPSDSAASPGQQAVFQAMDIICGNSDGTANLACGLSSGSVNNSLQLQQLSPQSAMQAETIAITSPYQFVRGVNRRLQKLREREEDEARGEQGLSWRSLQSASGGASGAEGYGFIGPFGISISGGGGFGDRDNADGQTGFGLDTQQANLIIDYPFTRELIGGLTFGYLRAERELGLNSGSLDSDSYRFAPFLSYRPTPKSYVTLLGGYARVDYDSTRTFTPFAGSVLTDAKADYGADQFFGSLGAGYTYRFGAWSLRGYGRGDYSHTKIEDFSETGAVDSADGRSYALEIKSQRIESVTSTLGAELSYAVSTPTIAAVIIPKLRAEWVHEFKNSGEAIKSTFSNLGSVALGPIAVAGPERNWANVGFGVQMLFPHAIVGFLDYETLFVDNGSNHVVSGGVRINF
ncbi:MAG: autotransporter outer membrane beta-barrel domain-containing protein, partial [Pseudomonadota bacterium]